MGLVSQVKNTMKEHRVDSSNGPPWQLSLWSKGEEVKNIRDERT